MHANGAITHDLYGSSLSRRNSWHSDAAHRRRRSLPFTSSLPRFLRCSAGATSWQPPFALPTHWVSTRRFAPVQGDSRAGSRATLTD